MTEKPCLDCNHKRKANPSNVCSKCGNTMCDKCWKKAGNALLGFNMIFGWGAMLMSSGKKRYKCKSCRSGSDKIAVVAGLLVIGALLAVGWYAKNMV